MIENQSKPIYKGKKFGNWLGSYDYDGELIIDDVDMMHSLVWCKGDKLTKEGKKVFAKILNAPFEILSNGNIVIYGEASEKLGYLFTSAAAGYIADSVYKKWFK